MTGCAFAHPLYPALLSYIAVFAPNVRGSTGFGRRFVVADVHHRRFAGVDDVADLAGHLVDAGLTDLTAIGCAGRSYGGYLTVAAMMLSRAVPGRRRRVRHHRLRDVLRRHRAVVLPDEGHEILGATSRAVYLGEVVHWLIRYPLGVGEPAHTTRS